ncbi:MAG: hypothetical protein JNK30_01485 [Phenylobacterium sp.]|uniref:hypothetical protein n=1 Tax=Phenylobacterium sp. TaxID=1871053 RepID=UPI001A3E2B79|nr:hypothetical protein [Phenylobacterium sp.]MBL8770028.1 hypothetical protein [Phenylobacterium sp.]
MPRQARIVIPGAPHNVTQRGNRRQPTFSYEGDYVAYLQIATEAFTEAEMEVWAYWLMAQSCSPHHSPVAPRSVGAGRGAKHPRYTRRINLSERWTGYLWQGRFASFPMDEAYLMTCAHYVGLNPVCAGLARRAVDWPGRAYAAMREGGPTRC